MSCTQTNAPTALTAEAFCSHPYSSHKGKTCVNVKALADFMKDDLKRYGFWRFTLGALCVVMGWRLPEIITALSVWRT